MSKIPPRLTFSGIDAPLYVPMDGEGNATVPHNLTTESLLVKSTSQFNGLVTSVGNLNIGGSLGVTGSANVGGSLGVTGSANVGGNLGVIGSANVGSLSTVGNVSVGAPGIFVGNGQGLTNLPPANIGLTPSFYFQSELIDFYELPNRFLPEAEPEVVPTVGVAIPCEMFGKPPGLYYWKTEANILLQNLFNSASGLVYWDGTKVTGETTWSLYQSTSVLNPIYSLTLSYLFLTSLTGFYVALESTNTSIDPLQPDNYYVNFYKVADLGGSATPLPTPTGLSATGTSGTTAAISWNYVSPYNYTIYNQGPTGAPSVVNVGSTGSYGLTGLTPSTAYSVEIQASTFVGSQTQVSARTGPVGYTTPA